MNRIMLLLVAVSIGLSAKADYTVTTQQPLYSNPFVSYSNTQPYVQSPYAQSSIQQYNQGYCQTPYQVGYQQQYVNPYQYQNPYGYRNNFPQVLNSSILGNATTNGTQGVIRNIGQSMLYSLMRGY